MRRPYLPSLAKPLPDSETQVEIDRPAWIEWVGFVLLATLAIVAVGGLLAGSYWLLANPIPVIVRPLVILFLLVVAMCLAMLRLEKPHVFGGFLLCLGTAVSWQALGQEWSANPLINLVALIGVAAAFTEGVDLLLAFAAKRFGDRQASRGRLPVESARE